MEGARASDRERLTGEESMLPARPVPEEEAPASAIGTLDVARVRGRLRDYLLLAKARLSLTVLASGAVGYWLGGAELELSHFLWFLAGTFLVVAGANAFNQVLEREPDSRMRRTAHRPIPGQRISAAEAAWVAAVGSGAGLAVLFLRGGLLTGALGLLGLVVYVCLYTPMKRRSSWSTLVGALAGALPTLMGFSASAQTLSPIAGCLFGIVFFWQFPHTWAIAATYREDYERVGHRALPERGVAGKTIACSLALVATSLLPAILYDAGRIYIAGASALGLLFLLAAVRFGDGRRRAQAAALLAASLFYLPVILAFVAFSKGGF
jgi:protoheme IX farnesyltransferase